MIARSAHLFFRKLIISINASGFYVEHHRDASAGGARYWMGCWDENCPLTNPFRNAGMEEIMPKHLAKDTTNYTLTYFDNNDKEEEPCKGVDLSWDL